jgi:hypothetical protein
MFQELITVLENEWGGGEAFYMLVLLFVYVCSLGCVLRGVLYICFRISDYVLI